MIERDFDLSLMVQLKGLAAAANVPFGIYPAKYALKNANGDLELALNYLREIGKLPPEKRHLWKPA